MERNHKELIEALETINKLSIGMYTSNLTTKQRNTIALIYMNSTENITQKEDKFYCPNCNSDDIYYPEKGSPNDDVVQCGGCRKLIEEKKMLKEDKFFGITKLEKEMGE